MDNLEGQGMVDMIDVMDDTGEYMAIIREYLEYARHMWYNQYRDREMFEEI